MTKNAMKLVISKLNIDTYNKKREFYLRFRKVKKYGLFGCLHNNIFAV